MRKKFEINRTKIKGKKFEINWTKIKGGCQSGRKVVTHNLGVISHYVL